MRTVFLILFITCLPALSYPQNLEKAKKLFGEKKYKQAKTEFEKILDNSESHEAYFYLGRTLFALREFDDASDAFEEAVDLNEKNAEYHFWLGQSYGAEAQEANFLSQTMLAPKVKAEFLRAVELDKNHIGARAALIQYYYRAPGIVGGSIEKAYEQAKILIKLDEKAGRLQLASIYLAEKKLKEAETEFKILEKKYGNDPDIYPLYNSYGYALLGVGRVNEAIEKFKKQVEIAPDQANPYDSLGEAYLAAGKKNEAREQFKKALSIDPKFEASINNLKKLDEGK